MVFVDEEQIATLERDMRQNGVLEGSKMANAFNMLRSNDLIWSYVVSNYLKGQQPAAFDLLHWNSDATRMPAANHSYYLRNCYLENRLSKGTMVLDNTQLDLSKVKVPVYNLATKEDHIAPAESVLYGSKFFGGPVKYVLSGSGHIAGVVNPPSLKKYQYWTNDNLEVENLAEWMKDATEHKGSWWPDWREWLSSIDPEEVPARPTEAGPLPAIENAPGSYVRVRA
jgi:polyhydroxyalkanoate synthase